MDILNIGIVGFGTVGAGVVEAIQKNSDLISKRVGFIPVVKRIADLDIVTDRGVEVPDGVLTTDAYDVIRDPEIQVVVELIGGTTFAKKLILDALRAGKPVVTANKALLATFGDELFQVASENNVNIWFEASVGGGIPCLKALREGLAANQIREILGILNGTCNYILTKMEREKADFDDVLAAAQAAGYAEANPALDVDGFDTAHKTAILASLAYGTWFNAEQVETWGIRNVTQSDIQYAAELGYRIKLLAIIKQVNGHIQLGVHPALVPASSLLGNVNDVFNAVWVRGDIVGDTMYYGRGAGRSATASAVIADIVDCGLNLSFGCLRRLPAFTKYEGYGKVMDSSEVITRYYVRLQINDKPGVLAKVSGILAKYNISIASVTQKENSPRTSVPMVILTHKAQDSAMRSALREIGELDDTCEKPVVFTIEDLA
ncbi:MAG: homoserine dehydrogenase [Lentisphaerae bacterium]|jgi:homoserine dehydrogenase|nr:homoserine dehydrogenase [Lentisphaerota bacterium]